MPWYGIAVIVYCFLNILLVPVYLHRSITITPASGVLTLLTQTGIIFAIIALAAH
jgi:hypothetical protein